MHNLETKAIKEQAQDQHQTHRETNDLNPNRNQVAEAQKQMSTQETAGVVDQG